MEKEKKWGGKRAGSGRKKNENTESLITLTIKIDKKHKQMLDNTSKMVKMFFGCGFNRNKYFENLIADEYEYYKESIFDEHTEQFYKILNKLVDDFISSSFSSLEEYPIPYRDYSELFNVRIKTNVEKEYISLIKDKYFNDKNSYIYDIKQAFSFISYDEFDSSCKQKEIKETIRIIKAIESKIDELFNLVYEDNFNYVEWLSDFNDFVSVERRSHLYDLD